MLPYAQNNKPPEAENGTVLGKRKAEDELIPLENGAGKTTKR